MGNMYKYSLVIKGTKTKMSYSCYCPWEHSTLKVLHELCTERGCVIHSCLGPNNVVVF